MPLPQGRQPRAHHLRSGFVNTGLYGRWGWITLGYERLIRELQEVQQPL